LETQTHDAATALFAVISSVDAVLDQHLPPEQLAQVKRILYGNPVDTLAVPDAVTSESGALGGVFAELFSVDANSSAHVPTRGR
jgi:hypothetical protein